MFVILLYLYLHQHQQPCARRKDKTPYHERQAGRKLPSAQKRRTPSLWRSAIMVVFLKLYFEYCISQKHHSSSPWRWHPDCDSQLPAGQEFEIQNFFLTWRTFPFPRCSWRCVLPPAITKGHSMWVRFKWVKSQFDKNHHLGIDTSIYELMNIE